MKNYHRLLSRQLKKINLDQCEKEEVSHLLDLVNRAYIAFDMDMAQLENTLEKSSHELFEANKRLKRNVELMSDRLLRVAGNIKEVIFEMDNSGNWTYLNPAWETLTGTKIKNSLNQPYYLSFKDAQGFPQKDFLDLRNRSQDIFHQKIEALSTSGNKKWMDFSIRSIRSKEGSKEGYIGTIVDITDMENARSKILTQYNELQNFVYIISHNVRAPISTLQGLVEVFEPENEELNTQIISHIGTTVEALDRTIKDLNHSLSLRKVSDEAFEEVELEEIFQDIELLLSKDIDSSNATIKIDFSKAPKLKGLKSYFANILFNLILNAIHYRAENRSPKILVTSEPLQNGGLKIIVEDNGQGMALDKENRKKIFDMYGRLSGKSEGKGMGLYLAKTQVEAMHGQIQVESEPGKGSVFTIVFDYNVRPKPIQMAKEGA